MTLKAVIFDMDGVLTDTVEPHYRSWKKITQEFKIPFTRQDNERLLGLTRRRSLEVILAGRELPDEQVQEILRRKNTYFLEFVRQMGPGDLLPGVQELLAELGSVGLRIGVASGSRNTIQVLSNLGIEGWIDVVVDGNTITRSKPAPDAFLEAAQALGVEPGACVALEDSASGVLAARDAGMCVIGIGPAERLGHAHSVVSSLSELNVAGLYELFDRWFALQVSPD